MFKLANTFCYIKSVVMRVGPRRDKPCVAFELGLSALKFTDSIKYLGIPYE